jgi:hypothetical protein
MWLENTAIFFDGISPPLAISAPLPPLSYRKLISFYAKMTKKNCKTWRKSWSFLLFMLQKVVFLCGIWLNPGISHRFTGVKLAIYCYLFKCFARINK